jgi:undecaprenyl-phosphate 4-deoxy-4-formamido-L-arabinose transferase
LYPDSTRPGATPRRLSVVIPVHNSASLLPRLVDELRGVLPQIADHWEVVLVNDGSDDGSFDVIVSLNARYPWVRGIDLMANVGQQNALLCGIRAARYEIIATLDDDLQHPPSELAKLVAAVDAGAVVAYGKPRHEKRSFPRYLASRATRLALFAAGGRAAGGLSAFRVFRDEVRKAIDPYYGPVGSIDALLSWGTARVAFVEVEHRARANARSRYTMRRLSGLALDFATSFSVRPLQVASLLGLLLTASGVAAAAYFLARAFVQGTHVRLIAWQSAGIAVVSGVQLLALGMIGEYVSRMHMRVMTRPSYVIQASTDPEPGTNGA